MTNTKSLAKDSVIYGGSTILVKMVSWLLTTLFTYTLTKAEYGMMTNLYAYIAVIMIILTFGMETGFFRFVNQTEKHKAYTVYSTTLIIVSCFVALFLFVFLYFLPSIRPLMWSEEIPDIYIKLIIVIMSMDAFSAIPFAYLRYKKRPVRFGFLKILNVVLYTVFCLYFLIVCPWINKRNPQLIDWFWKEDSLLIYVFISNLAATAIQTMCLFPELLGFKYKFDWNLSKTMLKYCFPLVIMGLAGMSNQVVDKLVFPAVYPDKNLMFDELGIYSACFKIALIMMIFTQAFRYAYEPFIFEKSKEKNASQSYAQVMKYFIIFGLLVFLGVMFYLDIIKYFISPAFFAGLPIVSIVLIGELFFAIYFNLSIWYKINDKTHWGAIFSVIGFIVIITINIIFIPQYSYMACAWAALIGNGLIMLLSYFIGQKRYPIKYDLKTIGLYFGLALILYVISLVIHFENTAIRLGFNTVLLTVYIFIVLKRDLPSIFNTTLQK